MLQNLLEQLRNAGTGSKVIAGLVLVAVVAIGATAAVVANKPHYELLWSELSASENAAVQKALANAGIPYEQSQPPGPYIISVDRSMRQEAQHAVAIAGALAQRPGGIVSSQTGIESVFLGKEERDQATAKRQMEEMEQMLEVFDFVVTANVTSAVEERRAFGGQARKTGSVVLTLRQRMPLSKEQKQTVASMVQGGLGIKPGDLTISDHEGNSLYNGSKFDETGGGGDWLETKQMFERDLEEKANSTLAKILGKDKAVVTVVSTWKRDLSTSVAEKADPAGKVVISETTATTKTPQGSTPSVGGATGFVEVGEAPASGEAGASSGGADQVAKSDDSTKQYYIPKETTRTVSLTPTLEHLSVSLALDKEFEDQLDEISSNVKASVGFQADRDGQSDTFSATVQAFYSDAVEVEGTEDGAEGAEVAEEPAAEPSPMMTMLLERGVEIVSALAFLFILMRSMKSASKTQTVEGEAPIEETIGEDDDMLERLAQAQIDELVKSDPERVGQILSAWAGEEKAAAGN